MFITVELTPHELLLLDKVYATDVNATINDIRSDTHLYTIATRLANKGLIVLNTVAVHESGVWTSRCAGTSAGGWLMEQGQRSMISLTQVIPAIERLMQND